MSLDARFAIGLALNLVFVAIEVTYGVLAHSLALVSDAGHNLGDVLGLSLAWGAVVLAQRQPTQRRTYGLRRTTILAALANSLLLVFAVGAIAVEAVGRFSHPHPVEGRTVVVVALAGIVVNAVSAWLFRSGPGGDLNLRAAFAHLAADAVVSLGVAATGVVILFTRWLWLDPAVSLVVGLVILAGTWKILRESLDLAMDAVPEQIDATAVDGYLRSVQGVQEVHDLHIWALSTTECALTVHLVSDEPADDRRLATVRAELRQRFGIEHTTIQFDQRHIPGGI